MTLSDVLDGAFKIMRANLRAIFLAAGAVVVPVQVVSTFAQRDTWRAGLFFGIDDSIFVAGEAGSGSGYRLELLTLVLALLTLPFVAGAVSRIVAASYLGRTVSAGEALRVARARFGALLWGWFLVHLVELAALLACFVPLVFVAPMFVLVAPAIAIEELSGVAGIRRSWRLVAQRYWPVLGISLLGGLVASFSAFIIALLPAVVAGAVGGPVGLVLLAVGSSISQIVGTALVTIIATLLYFDARIRHEAFDLQLIAANMSPGARA